MGKPGSIFISYRRSDSIAEAGRVYDKLVEAFGPERIFKDVDNIPYGADFVEYLDQAVARCDVLIPLIGRSWLTVTDSHGKRRLDDPNDFVRIEIASALKRDILVLPVLIGGATMPGSSDLPDDLQTLARRNAAQARYDPDFHSDMRRIVAKLKDYFADRGITVIPSHNVSAANVPAANIPAANVSASPAQPAPAQPPPNTRGIRVPMILSGVSGAFALYDSIMGIGTAASWIVAALLFGSMAMLMTRKLWAWGIAIAIQVAALVVFSTELPDIFSDYYLHDEVLLDELVVIIPVIVLALITTAILLLPKTRRNFS